MHSSPVAPPSRLARFLLTAALAGGALSYGVSAQAQTMLDTAAAGAVQNTLNQIGTPNLMPAINSAKKAAATVQHGNQATAAALAQTGQAQPGQPAPAPAAPTPATPSSAANSDQKPAVQVVPLTAAQQAVLDMGQKNLAAKKYDLARKQFETLIAQNYNNPEPHFGLALTLLAQKDEKGAIFELNQFQTLAPDRFEGPYNLGVIANRAKRYDDALKFFGDAVALMKGKASVTLQTQVMDALAGEQTRKADFSGLTATLTDMVALNPQNMDLQYRLAQAQMLAGQGAQALPGLYAVLQKQPGRLNAIKLLADIYVNQGLADRAVRELDAALPKVRTDSDRAALLLYKANVLVGQGNVRDALLAVQAAQQQDNKNVLAYSREAELWAQQGDRGRALKAYQTAATLAPKDARLRTDLAALQLTLNQNAAAAATAIQALKLWPDAATKARAQYVQGVAAYNQGQYTQARAALSASIQGAPTADALFWLGLSQYALKDYTASVGTLSESVKLNATPTSRQNLAAALLAAARYPEAEAILRGLVTDNPKNSEAWYFLGMAQKSQLKDVEARHSLKTAANLGNARAKDALK